MLLSFARMASYQMRRKDRQIISKDELFSLAKSCKFASVGLVDKSDPNNIKPYVVPLSFGMKWEKESDNPSFYFHSAKNGRKIQLLKNNSHACITLVKSCNINPVENIGQNSDICEASIIHYESVIAEGQFEIIKNEKEKQEALSIILDHYDQPTGPMSMQTLSQTCVFKLTTENISGKKNFH
ncbi:hypothetical protein M9Y10_033965 [Tritrichomonas musculus]|uniref:Pyridoxamine 5'-phosphate oxidase family protein n=1 Tax=Tritrichomonas musculus TaxID=1915356 RepID=A0ABR2KDS3_9EUKA